MWERIYVTIWYALIAAMGVYEVVMYLDGQERTPPLTAVLVRESPWYVTMGFLTWLWVHFASRYLGKPIL